MNAVVKNRPQYSLADLEPTRRAMDASVLDCLVENYEHLIPQLGMLPDLNDRHVLAAAIKGGADLIVTKNLSDFPSSVLAPYDIEAVHPDDFLLDLESLDQGAFYKAARMDFQHYKRPPVTFASYIDRLSRDGVPKTAALMRQLEVLFTSGTAAPREN